MATSSRGASVVTAASMAGSARVETTRSPAHDRSATAEEAARRTSTRVRSRAGSRSVREALLPERDGQPGERHVGPALAVERVQLPQVDLQHVVRRQHGDGVDAAEPRLRAPVGAGRRPRGRRGRPRRWRTAPRAARASRARVTGAADAGVRERRPREVEEAVAPGERRQRGIGGHAERVQRALAAVDHDPQHSSLAPSRHTDPSLLRHLRATPSTWNTAKSLPYSLRNVVTRKKYRSPRTPSEAEPRTARGCGERAGGSPRATSRRRRAPSAARPHPPPSAEPAWTAATRQALAREAAGASPSIGPLLCAVESSWRSATSSRTAARVSRALRRSSRSSWRRRASRKGRVRSWV